MPQSPNQVLAGLYSGAPKALNVNSAGSLITAPVSRTLNITAATVIKASAGTIGSISVLVAGSAPGAVHDCATTGAAAAGNKVAVIADAVGVTALNWPATAGIVVVPGTGQTIAVSFS